MAQIIGAVSEMERENIVSNANAGMKKRAESGLWDGGIVLGYDNADKKLILNEEESEIVRNIFELYALKDYGYNLITKHLNSRGLKTKKSNTWAHSMAKSVLDNLYMLAILDMAFEKIGIPKERIITTLTIRL